MSKSNLSRFERGMIGISFERLYAMLQEMNMSLVEFELNLSMVRGKVDTSTPGEYKVTYTNGTTSKEITVTVTTAPTSNPNLNLNLNRVNQESLTVKDTPLVEDVSADHR